MMTSNQIMQAAQMFKMPLTHARFRVPLEDLPSVRFQVDDIHLEYSKSVFEPHEDSVCMDHGSYSTEEAISYIKRRIDRNTGVVHFQWENLDRDAMLGSSRCIPAAIDKLSKALGQPRFPEPCVAAIKIRDHERIEAGMAISVLARIMAGLVVFSPEVEWLPPFNWSYNLNTSAVGGIFHRGDVSFRVEFEAVWEQAGTNFDLRYLNNTFTVQASLRNEENANGVHGIEILEKGIEAFISELSQGPFKLLYHKGERDIIGRNKRGSLSVTVPPTEGAEILAALKIDGGSGRFLWIPDV